jgi:hypothetical protein
MGHLRLGHLPRTHRWKQVIGLIEDGADLPELADASFHASLTGLERVPSDPGFLTVLGVIIELAEASRETDLKPALLRAGIDSDAQQSPFGFLSSVSNVLSNHLGTVYPRSDVGKIALDTFIESLTKLVRGKSGSLFGAADDAKSLSAAFRGNEFKSLMHEFYSGFTSRYLSYYLSRELPHHVGGGKRFANLDEHTEFTRQFDLHCRQTVRIADEFTPGWVGKAIYEDDTGPDAIRRYAFVAFKKLASEFQRSGG